MTEKIWDKETRMLWKTRKATAKMGGLYEERPKKGRGGRKVERKGQQRGPVEKLTKVAVHRSVNWPASPLQNGNQGKNKWYVWQDNIGNFIEKIVSDVRLKIVYIGKSRSKLCQVKLCGATYQHPELSLLRQRCLSFAVGDFGLGGCSNHIDGATIDGQMKTDLSELFNKLGLVKYSGLFQQQEVYIKYIYVDYSMLLTFFLVS